MRRMFAVLAMVVAAILLSAASVAGSAGPPRTPAESVAPAAWSTPVRALAGSFDELSEVVDSQGHVHIAVTGNGNLWYVTDRTGTWTHTRVLSESSGVGYAMPSIALDEQDRVHIAAMRIHGEGDRGIWYLTDRGRTRGTFPASPTRIAPNGNGEPVLRASNGHLFLVDVKDWCCVGSGVVQLRTNVTGTWTVSTIGPGDEPSFRLGTDGRARVAYLGDDGQSIWYAAASTATGHFHRQQIPSPATSTADSRTEARPLLALTTSNQPRVAWEHFASGGTDVRYSWRTSSGWHAPMTVASGRPIVYTIGFDVDTHGRPNVAIGGTSIHVRVLSPGVWHSTTVTSSSDVADLVLRRALGGHSVAAWTDHDGGVWVSRN